MRATNSWRGVRIYTIGHSTRSIEELARLLHAFDVAILADVRTIPRSRHNPQFNADALPKSLRREHVRYAHLPALGGLRRTHAGSPNRGFRNTSFRGYADYMQTPEFEGGLAQLQELAREGTVAVMCAEAVPFRCHRSLIADALLARGADVAEIASAKRAAPHRMTPFALVEGAHITYPGEGAGQLTAAGPFHFEATVRVLQRRPSNLVDVWTDGAYRRVMTTAHGPELIEVLNHGSIAEPQLSFEALSGELPVGEAAEVGRTLRHVLGLEVDPVELQRVARAAPKLRDVVAALRGMRPPRYAALFEAFANVVPFQQVSLDAGVAAVRRLVERFGRPLEHDGRTHWAFPEAAAIADAKPLSLTACGLSRSKADALRALARAVADDDVSYAKLAALPSEDAIRWLVDLPGIGPWSAHLVLLRGLGRLDVFPPGDVGAQRGLGALLGVRTSAGLERVVARLGARRGYLYFCALGHALLTKELIHPASTRARTGRAPLRERPARPGSRPTPDRRRAARTAR
jgi:3-methyladenine DNA glycosylase/8-oxoguanine DNA glycosylase